MAGGSGDEVGLQAFIESAARSLAGAQQTLGAPVNLQSELVLARAELEAKVALKTDAAGRLSLQPMSSQDLLQSKLQAGGISTLRVNFVATAGDPSVAAGAPPTLKPDEVAGRVRQLPDLLRLRDILGELTIDATFVPQARRWMVTARDQTGRIVREVITPDERGTGDAR